MPEKGFSSGVSYLGLGSPENAQGQVFGSEYTKKDLSDYSSLAYSALMKQQEQAFTEAMYNYNNWYNSDVQRMKRRLAAGLNPYGLEGSPAASPSSAPSAPVARSAGTAAKGVQATASALQNVIGLLSQAREVYDLLENKTPLARSQRDLMWQQGALASQRAVSQGIENDWQRYITYGPEEGDLFHMSPRGQLYQFQTSATAAKIDQLYYLIEELYPSQVERNEALSALDLFRNSIMHGQNDAILNISTGNETADAVLKYLTYWISDNAPKAIPTFGFSKRFP